MSSSIDHESTILTLESAALARWGQGDPDGYLEISDASVSYFDPFSEQRIDGLPTLTAYYSPLRGRIRIEQDEIIDPRIQLIGDVAILTFNYRSHGSEGEMRWHCTEVYARRSDGWKIVHTHWSLQRSTAP